MNGHIKAERQRGDAGDGRGGDSYHSNCNLIITENAPSVNKPNSLTEGISSHVLPNLARKVAIRVVYALETWLYYAWLAVNGRLLAVPEVAT